MPSSAVSSVLAKLQRVKPHGSYYMASCPAHGEDKNPSLSITEGDDGRALLKCHAGCEAWQIVAALGMTEAELFPQEQTSQKRQIVATYDYKDESGKLLFQAVRFSPKGFTQRQPDPDHPGTWIYDLKGVRRVVYRLPELKDQRAILVCEGEKDCDKAWGLGIPATCNPMGAGKWQAEYAQQLRAQGVLRVAVIPDNDPVGAAHATVVTASLQAVGIEVRLVLLPGLGEHGDLADYIAGGKTKDDILALIKGVPISARIEERRSLIEAAEPKRFQCLTERYIFEIRPEGVTFDLGRLRRGREGVTGELTVRVNGYFKDAKTYQDGVLSWGDLNLAAVQSRTQRAKSLAERSGNKHVDWHGWLEEFVVMVIEAERKGKPAEVLAESSDEGDNESNDAWDILGYPILCDLPQVIFGDSASGKSYLAMWIAGMLAQQGFPVLYADWEFSKKEHKRRLNRLFRPAPKDVFYTRCELPLKHEAERLAGLVLKHKIKYAIADSIGFAVDGPAESQEGASAYFRYLRMLGIGSLSIAHIPKQYDDNREAQIFGSVFFRHGARSVWFIERAKDNPRGELRFGLYHRKSNIGELLTPRGFKLLFRGDRVSVEKIDLDSVDELAANLPLLERVKRALSNGAITLKALAEEVDASVPTVRSTVNRHKSHFIKLGNKIGLVEKSSDEPPADSVDF